MIKRLFLTLTLLLSTFMAANACDFSFSVGENKKVCHSGETIELTVTLQLIHRVCNVAPTQTKFKIDGVKVVSASNWKPVSDTKFERVVKLEVLNDGKKNITVLATRTCDKEGGEGLFTLPKE